MSKTGNLTIVLIVAVAALAYTAGAASAAAATLRLVPNPVGAGAEVTALGAGFCATPACPKVVIRTGGQDMATTDVKADGTFTLTFKVLLIPGQYRVVASQPAGSGAANEASTGLMVLAVDRPPSDNPPTSPPATSTPSGTPAPTDSGSPTTSPSPSASSIPSPASSPTAGAADSVQPSATSTAPPGGNGTSSTSSWLPALAVLVLIGAGAAGILLWRRRRA